MNRKSKKVTVSFHSLFNDKDYSFTAKVKNRKRRKITRG